MKLFVIEASSFELNVQAKLRSLMISFTIFMPFPNVDVLHDGGSACLTQNNVLIPLKRRF